jgi:hypothetical protein
MRDKHNCQICNEIFSRHWNMERHLRRKHYLDPQSLLFPFQYEIYQAPKFNTGSPKYFRSSPIFHDSPDFFSGRSAYLQYCSAYSKNSFPSNPHNAFDGPLEILRKAVEFNKLRQELSSTMIQQPYHMAFQWVCLSSGHNHHLSTIC